MLSGTDALQSFREFINAQAGAFRRIAIRADVSVSVHDVQQDAWVSASEISEKCGHPINFTNPDDQLAVLAWLYCKFIKLTSKRLRSAVRIDSDDEEVTPSYSLAGSDDENPLSQIIQAKSDQAAQEKVPAIAKESYSQASAYAMLLAKFDCRQSFVAKLLGITRRAFVQRFQRAYAWIKVQPSLFDGLAPISTDFMQRSIKSSAVQRRGPIDNPSLMQQLPLIFEEQVIEK